VRSEDLLAVTLFLFIVYLILRTLAFEILTPILRRVPPVRRRLQDIVAQGRLSADKRSAEIFANAMGGYAHTIRALTGRGWVGGLTFMLTIAMLFFLTALPLMGIHQANDVYAQALRSMRDPDIVSNGPKVLCLLENGAVAVQRQTGQHIVTIPPGFSPYPFDAAHNAVNTRAYSSDRFYFFLRELMQGREMTDDPKRLAPQLRVSDFAREYVVDGRMTGALADFTSPSPANAAIATDIRAFCAKTVPPPAKFHFTSLRPRRDYDRLFEMGRTGFLGLLEDPEVQNAYVFMQRSVLLAKFAYVLATAMLAGLVALVSFKLSAWLMGVSRRWILVNVFIIAFGLVLAPVITGIYASLTKIVDTLEPLSVSYLLSNAPDGGGEREYRDRFNRLVPKVVVLKERLCVAIGRQSPLYDICRLTDAILVPWNARTHEFDFGMMFPDSFGTNGPSQKSVIAWYRRSTLTFMITYAGMQTDQPSVRRDEIEVWNGVHSSPIAILIVSPFLLGAAFAVLLLAFLEGRRAVVKRVRRIVR
jgi:hypothetical protein